MPDLAVVAPALATLLAVGTIASAFAAVGISVLPRATFAARAALLQSSVLVLLIVSVTALVPRVTVRSGAVEPRGSGTSANMAERLTSISPITASPRIPVFQPPLARLLVAAWLLGALVHLTRLAGGAWQLAAVRSRARRCAHQPGVLVSDEVDVPFVHGWYLPTIIVPAASESWTADTWRSVLIHESAHIERGDVAMLWVRAIALALHWFNPAVQWLVRRTDEACEGACDDVVVLQGGVRAQYANTLVSFADAAWPYASVPSMAARTGLEHRVAAIMDHRRTRRRANRRDRMLPVLVGVLAGPALAFVVPRPAIASPRNVESARYQPPQPTQSTRRGAADTILGSRARSASALRERPRARVTNDTTEALLGLGQLLEDGNPIVRQTASDALRAWGTMARATLEPIARNGDGERSVQARRALATLGRQDVNP